MTATPRELWRRLLRRPAPIAEPAPARTVQLVLRAPDADDYRDALALIECAHQRDELGAFTVLRYGRPAAVALATSIIAHGLLAELCESAGGDHDTAMQRWRQWAADE